MIQAVSHVDMQIFCIKEKDPVHLKHKISGGNQNLRNQGK